MSFFNAGIQVPKDESILINGSTSGTVTLDVPAIVTSYTLTLPANDGTVNQVMQTDGAGTITFNSVSVAADDITVGDAEVTISTSSGDVNINAPTAQTIDMSINSVDQLVVGTSDIKATVAINPSTNDGAALGTGILQWSDLHLADGATINFDNSNVTLTHISDTGVRVNAEKQLQFRQSSEVIHSTSAGKLDIDAASTIELTATNVNFSVTTANVDGAVEVTGVTTVFDTTTSTTKDTGALVVEGGVGIEENLNVGGNSNLDGTVDMTGVTNVYSTLDVSGDVNFNSTTTSTTSSTGALVVDGGVGVVENLNVGGDVVVTGDLTVNGTTTTINSNVTSIDDPVIELGTAVNGEDYERGLRLIYHNGSTAKDAFIGWHRSGANDVFTFAKDATFTAANVVASITTVGDAKFATITADTALVPDASDGATLGTTSLFWSDLYLATGGLVSFNNGDTTLTNDANGLLVSGTNHRLTLNNTAVYIENTAATNDLVIVAEDTTLTGNLDVSTGNLDLTLGDFNVVAGDINVSVGDLVLGAGSNKFTVSETTGEVTVDLAGQDKDLIFTVNDGGVADNEVMRIDAANSAVLIASTNELRFTDSASNISTDGAGTLTIATNVDINLNADVTISNGLTVTGTTTHTGDVTSGNVTVSGTFYGGVDQITSNSSNAAARTVLVDTTYYASIKSINITNDSSTFFSCSNTGMTGGQLLHLFYENGGLGSSNIDFGNGTLFAGSGSAQYLIFSQTGQSATLVYLDNSTNGGTDGWRIINTGGTVV